jgi:hypothetical protein
MDKKSKNPLVPSSQDGNVDKASKNPIVPSGLESEIEDLLRKHKDVGPFFSGVIEIHMDHDGIKLIKKVNWE